MQSSPIARLSRTLDQMEKLTAKLLLIGFQHRLGSYAELLRRPGGLERIGQDLLAEMHREERERFPAGEPAAESDKSKIRAA